MGVDEENDWDRRSGGHIFQRQLSVIGIGPVRRAGVPEEAAGGADVAVVHIPRIVEMCLFERSRRYWSDFGIGKWSSFNFDEEIWTQVLCQQGVIFCAVRK